MAALYFLLTVGVLVLFLIIFTNCKVAKIDIDQEVYGDILTDEMHFEWLKDKLNKPCISSLHMIHWGTYNFAAKETFGWHIQNKGRIFKDSKMYILLEEKYAQLRVTEEEDLRTISLA